MKLRVITINSNYERYAFIQKTKKIDATKYKIIEKNDCVLITNLLNKRKYSDKKILQFYRQRWDIETYFKFLKFNHKFQHMDQNKILKYTYKKSYLCIIILHYIMKIIQNYLLAEKNIKSKIFNKKNHVSKINNSPSPRK